MILIKNANVLTMTGANYDRGDVLVDGGKIVAVGDNLSATGAKEIDAHGMIALPGIVDAHCHIGMFDDAMQFEGDDGNECTDPVTPQLRALDGIYALDRCFTEAYQAGIITVATGPGSANAIGGQFLAMKTYGKYLKQMVIREPLALKIAFGENPKRVYGEHQKAPMTRMATAALMRKAFIDAQTYMKKQSDPDESKRPERDLAKETLAMALRGEIMVKAHAHRSDDILTAIRIAEEFNLKMSLDHCTEGYLISEALQEAKLPVILGPLLSDRSKIELRNMTFAAPGILEKAGVEFAIMTDHPVIPLQYLPVEAGLAVRFGLSEEAALRAITINAAKAIGLADRVGSLEPGKDADLFLSDGHPFDTRSHVKLVIVNGEVVHEA